MPQEFDPAGGPQSRVIARDPVLGDWIAEQETGITYEVNESDGLWNKPGYLSPTDLVQYATYFDTDACTDYGCANSSTIQCRAHLIKGRISPSDVVRLAAAGFIKDGVFQQLDPHYNAILAGTKYGVGNFLYKPWDAARKYGMIPVGLLPFPQTQKEPYYGPSDYYNAALITDEIKAIAQVYLDVFETRYDIISPDTATIAKHRQQAPICVDIGVCSPWNAGPVPKCSLVSGHCVVNDGSNGTDEEIRDSYIPNNKTLGMGYNISYAIKGVTLVKSLLAATPQILPFQYQWNEPLQFNQTSPDIKALQDFLKIDGEFPTTVPSSGLYGNITAAAVLAFQLKYKIGDPIAQKVAAGHFVGSLTLPILNNLCNQV